MQHHSKKMHEEHRFKSCAGTMTWCCCWYKPCDGPFNEDTEGFNWWFIGTVGPPCFWPFWCGAGALALAGTAIGLAGTMCCCCFCCNNTKQQAFATEKAWDCCKNTCCCFIVKDAYKD